MFFLLSNISDYVQIPFLLYLILHLGLFILGQVILDLTYHMCRKGVFQTGPEGVREFTWKNTQQHYLRDFCPYSHLTALHVTIDILKHSMGQDVWLYSSCNPFLDTRIVIVWCSSLCFKYKFLEILWFGCLCILQKWNVTIYKL